MSKLKFLAVFLVCICTYGVANAQWTVYDPSLHQTTTQQNILKMLSNSLDKAYQAVTQADISENLSTSKAKYVKQCESLQWAIKQYDELNNMYKTLEKTRSFINKQIGTVEGIYSFFNSDFSDPSTIQSMIRNQANSLRDSSIEYDSAVTQAADKVLGSDLCEPVAKAEQEMYNRAEGAVKVSDEADKAAQKIAESVSVQDKGVDNAVKDGSANVLNLLHAIYKSSSYSGQMLNRMGVSLSALMRLQAEKEKKEAKERLESVEREAELIVEEDKVANELEENYRKKLEEQHGNQYMIDWWSKAKMK